MAKVILDGLGEPMGNSLVFANHFDVEHYRKNCLIKDDRHSDDSDYSLIGRYSMHNDVTDEGVNLLWNVMFDALSELTPWYLGLISNASFSTLANGDVMASHIGWLEFVSYSGGNRPAWGNGASSARAMTNGTAVSFTISSNGTLYGLFVTSDNTIGGTSGKLWATAGFPATVPVVSTDVLKATYTISA